MINSTPCTLQCRLVLPIYGSRSIFLRHSTCSSLCNLYYIYRASFLCIFLYIDDCYCHSVLPQPVTRNNVQRRVLTWHLSQVQSKASWGWAWTVMWGLWVLWTVTWRSERKLPLLGRITYRHNRQPKLPNFFYTSSRLFGGGVADAGNCGPTFCLSVPTILKLNTLTVPKGSCLFAAGLPTDIVR